MCIRDRAVGGGRGAARRAGRTADTAFARIVRSVLVVCWSRLYTAANDNGGRDDPCPNALAARRAHGADERVGDPRDPEARRAAGDALARGRAAVGGDVS